MTPASTHVPDQVLATLLPIHLPANGPGKAAEDDSSTWGPVQNAKLKFLAPEFGLVQPELLQPLREWLLHGRLLSSHLCSAFLLGAGEAVK